MISGSLPASLSCSAGRAGRRSLCKGEPASAAASALEREWQPLNAMAAGATTYLQPRVSVALWLAQQRKRRRALELVGAKRDFGGKFREVAALRRCVDLVDRAVG